MGMSEWLAVLTCKRATSSSKILTLSVSSKPPLRQFFREHIEGVGIKTDLGQSGRLLGVFFFEQLILLLNEL